MRSMTFFPDRLARARATRERRPRRGLLRDPGRGSARRRAAPVRALPPLRRALPLLRHAALPRAARGVAPRDDARRARLRARGRIPSRSTSLAALDRTSGCSSRSATRRSRSRAASRSSRPARSSTSRRAIRARGAARAPRDRRQPPGRVRRGPAGHRRPQHGLEARRPRRASRRRAAEHRRMLGSSARASRAT